MSYIVKALRKLEQERRRVTVTEMTLFRGLSERWKSETPVWRYLLVLSLVANAGLLVWLLTTFFSGGGAAQTGKPGVLAAEPASPVKKEPVTRTYQKITNPDLPLKINLEVRPSQGGQTHAPGSARRAGRDTSDRSRMRSIEKDGRHTLQTVEHPPQKVLSVDEMEMHENGAYSSPKVMTWKDEKGNIHYSGTAGRD
ncbi:MAG: hypothetical protein HZB31_12825 [Nitrospirae bacterium]|nr:hypothetical protein [Nitrospirota bacterium]